MNSGLTSHHQLGHKGTGPWSERSEKQVGVGGVDLATPGLLVQRVFHYTTAVPGVYMYINSRYTTCCSISKIRDIFNV